jgi:peptide/nickel transport system substrate-binding protein
MKMHLKNSITRGLLHATCLAGLALAPAAAFGQETPKTGGTLKIVMAGTPNTYDCHAATSITDLTYLAPHYSTLLEFDPDNYPEIIAGAAEDWSVSDDQMTFTFHLRPNIMFHDGSTLTAEDVKATYERLRSPPEGVISARVGSFENIDSIDVLDDTTVVFHLKQAQPGMDGVFASPWNCLYSAELMASDPSYPAETVMGSGPYNFVEHVPGSQWSGTRFDDYFREGQPYLDGFQILTVDGAGAVNAIASGQADANFRIITPPQKLRIEEVRGDATVFQSVEGGTVNMVTVNAAKPPFDDIRVRHALDLAIDRVSGQANLSKITSAGYIGTILRPSHPYALTPEELSDLPGYGDDIEARRAEARRLLAEAGYPDLKLRFVNRNLQDPYEIIGVFLVDQWRQIGVTAEMVPVDTAAWTTAQREGDFDVVYDLNAPPDDDATSALQKYIAGSSTNFANLEDDEITRLFEAQKTELDPEKRSVLVKELQRAIMEKSAYLHLFRGERIVALPADLRGYTLTPSFYVGLDLADLWFDR